MSSYIILKFIHIATVIISIIGFIIRGIWMIQSSPKLKLPWVRLAPHINDTILLGSAIILVFITSQYPGSYAWINAKIIALIIYIILGTIALKRGKSRVIRITSFFLAVLTFAYIAMVAVNKNPLAIWAL